MTEGGYTQKINRAVRRLRPAATVWKIHDSYAGGVPDAYYSDDGADLWVEFKWAPSFPKRAPIKPALTALQKDWLRRAHSHGRKVAVVVGSPDGAVIYPALTWDNNPVSIAQTELYTPKGVANWVAEQINPATK